MSNKKGKSVLRMWVVLLFIVATGAARSPGCPGHPPPVRSPGPPCRRPPNSGPYNPDDYLGPPIPREPPNLCCRVNETLKMCKNICPGQDCNSQYVLAECNIPLPCRPGCDCIDGYLRNKENRCVLKTECPPPPWLTTTTELTPPDPEPKCEQENEIYLDCKINCSNDICPENDQIGLSVCETSSPCLSGCACKIGFRRRSKTNDTCIPAEECPPVECTRQNEQWNSCPSPCNEKNCEDAFSPPVICYTLIKNCQPKCDCKPNHFRDSTGHCVPVDQCPNYQCGANETYVPCQFNCPTIFCPISEYDSLLACSSPYPCAPGCSCLSNFRRRSREDRTCIPTKECPPVPCSGVNEVWNSCPSSCLAENCSDASKPTPICYEKRPFCQPKCVCAEGYYRNESNVCVPASECPLYCDASANQTEVYCPSFKCPNQFCPDSDDPGKYACKPPRGCPSGCGCQLGYRYKSNEELICILAKDCPAQPCTTQPNEEWDPCPSCLAESCADANTPDTGVCNEFAYICQPQCRCKKGFYRDESNICVPKTECPLKCDASANQTEVYCPSFKCPHQFCPDSDNTIQYACKPPQNCPSGCGCQLGYRYKSYEDLTCILAEDCSAQPCTSQPNEEWHPCPSCLAESCADANIPDTGVCNEFAHNCEPQCICMKGFYRNESNICVPKSECPLQCDASANQTEVYCPSFKCPHQFCPDSDNTIQYACKPPRGCPSGCGCQLGYRYKSYEDLTCILAEDCPAQPCTSQPNEEWNPCPLCLAESCADADTPDTGVCNEFAHDCRPQCICKKEFYRNESNICVPKSECSESQCAANETELECPTKCSYNFCPQSDVQEINRCEPPGECQRGCGCKNGYLYKSSNDLTCILPEDCPSLPCTTNPNEEWDSCPKCRQEFCSDPLLSPTDASCVNYTCQPRCVCKDGFLRNESNICIPKEQCTKCEENETYVRCKVGCPTDFCPEDDNQFLFACDPTMPCNGGCICKLNYKRRSPADPTCIPLEKCPPVNCTRPNEIWSYCPSACLKESCQSQNQTSASEQSDCDSFADYCQPRCVCDENYYRNDEGICVPRNECPSSMQSPEPVTGMPEPASELPTNE